MADGLTYHLEDFDGPLDLLLHLIRVNEMDIFDIPITEITEQYLVFIHQAEERNLDIAGEFLVMAANLMAIKSQDLLPPTDIDEDAELAEYVDEPDPKTALMAQLLEYQQYQAAATQLRVLEEDRQQQFSRAPETVDPAPMKDVALPTSIGVQISDLQVAFNKLLQRRHMQIDRQKVRSLTPVRPSIDVKMTEIMDCFVSHQSLTFEQLFKHQASKDELIVTFLGVLELVRDQQLVVFQSHNFDQINLKKQAVGEE